MTTNEVVTTVDTGTQVDLGAAQHSEAKSKRSERIANKRKDKSGKGGSSSAKRADAKASNDKPKATGLSPFERTVLGLLKKDGMTRRELIVATGRGTGWAVLFGAHTKGAACKVAGTNDAAGDDGLLARGLVTRNGDGVYNLTAAGRKAIA